jgi:hypothetical protein
VLYLRVGRVGVAELAMLSMRGDRVAGVGLAILCLRAGGRVAGGVGLAMLYLRGGRVDGVGLAMTSLLDAGVRYAFNIPRLRRNGVSEGVGI